jgi:hypothetical protein
MKMRYRLFVTGKRVSRITTVRSTKKGVETVPD